MIRIRLAAVLCCLVGGTALAQPASEPPQEPAPQPEPAPPPPPVQPPQPPQPVVVAPTVAPAPAPDRPTGFSIGIGLGYRFPTSLQIPNATSVRFRLGSGITFEPTLVFAGSTQEVDVGTVNSGSTTEYGIGTLARFPLVQHRKTVLELLAAFEVDSVDTDPSDQASNDNTTTTTTTAGYGLAVGWWITPHLQVSLSATNSLVNYTHVREVTGPDFITVTNTTTFGLIFDPTVVAMIHLYH